MYRDHGCFYLCIDECIHVKAIEECWRFAYKTRHFDLQIMNTLALLCGH